MWVLVWRCDVYKCGFINQISAFYVVWMTVVIWLLLLLLFVMYTLIHSYIRRAELCTLCTTHSIERKRINECIYIESNNNLFNSTIEMSFFFSAIPKRMKPESEKKFKRRLAKCTIIKASIFVLWFFSLIFSACQFSNCTI